MAADILAYRRRMCPSARTRSSMSSWRATSRSSTASYGVNFFPLPEPHDLRRGDPRHVLARRQQKMSKSDPSDQSRINMTDDPETIALKIRHAKTDPHVGLSLEPERRPEAEPTCWASTPPSPTSPSSGGRGVRRPQFSFFKRSSPTSPSPSSADRRRDAPPDGRPGQIDESSARRRARRAIAADNLRGSKTSSASCRVEADLRAGARIECALRSPNGALMSRLQSAARATMVEHPR